MRVAVCDDCPEDALSLKNKLTGYEISIYSGADSLLTYIENKNIQYDLYLLDIFMMESMNGIELAGKLREIQQENFKKLLLKVQKNLVLDREKKLIYSWWGKNGLIPYGKIRYICSSGHTLSICCTDGSIQKSAWTVSRRYYDKVKRRYQEVLFEEVE